MFLSLAVHKNQIIKEWVHQTNLLSKCGINIKTYIHIYIYVIIYIIIYVYIHGSKFAEIWATQGHFGIITLQTLCQNFKNLF